MPQFEGDIWVEDDNILGGICLVFIQYMYIYLAMMREPERMLRNHNESLARLWISSRTFWEVEVPLWMTFWGYLVLCRIPRASPSQCSLSFKFISFYRRQCSKLATLDFWLVCGFTFLRLLVNPSAKLIVKYSSMYLQVHIEKIIFNKQTIKN
jgi:hypothetical protein